MNLSIVKILLICLSFLNSLKSFSENIYEPNDTVIINDFNSSLNHEFYLPNKYKSIYLRDKDTLYKISDSSLFNGVIIVNNSPNITYNHSITHQKDYIQIPKISDNIRYHIISNYFFVDGVTSSVERYTFVVDNLSDNSENISNTKILDNFLKYDWSSIDTTNSFYLFSSLSINGNTCRSKLFNKYGVCILSINSINHYCNEIINLNSIGDSIYYHSSYSFEETFDKLFYYSEDSIFTISFTTGSPLTYFFKGNKIAFLGSKDRIVSDKEYLEFIKQNGYQLSSIFFLEEKYRKISGYNFVVYYAYLSEFDNVLNDQKKLDKFIYKKLVHQ